MALEGAYPKAVNSREKDINSLGNAPSRPQGGGTFRGRFAGIRYTPLYSYKRDGLILKKWNR